MRKVLSSKKGRARFDMPEWARHVGWPKAGTAPRLGGQLGRCVRNSGGDVVRLMADDVPSMEAQGYTPQAMAR